MWRTWIIMLIVLAVALAGGPPVLSAAAAECLHLSGTADLDKTETIIGEPFTLTFTLTPGGELTQTIQRPSADIVLVLDVSGSMNEKMKSHQRQTRLEALKEASRTLVNRLRNAGVGDRIGVVAFQTSSEEKLGLTANYNRVQQVVDGLRAGGGTNMGSGLEQAKAMLDASSAERKAVIALTDGLNTHYTETVNLFGITIRRDAHDPNRGRQYAKQWADRLGQSGIPVYTIALGQIGMGDIDHRLLEEIAEQTGGEKYDADDADRLAEVFDAITEVITVSGQLSDIHIIQPLPADGFELAGDNLPGTSVSGRTLSVPIPPITYPYDASSVRIVEVTLRQTSIVQQFQFEDAQLAYRNACGAMQEAVIPNGHLLSVTGWKDRWGNLYVGRGDGEVTRYRLGDLANPQWSIREQDSRVTGISFQDSAPDQDDDAIVHVAYENGTTSVWDLRPAAPDLTIVDADGLPVTDTAWHKGDGLLAISGSSNRLPEHTVYHNDDFLDEGGTYIAAYRYRIGGAWQQVAAGETVVLGASDEALPVEAEALTAAISGDANELVPGLAAAQTVYLDDAPPRVTLAIDYAGGGDALNPVIRLTAEDAASGVARISVTAETTDGVARTLHQTYSPASGSAVAEWPLSDFFADAVERTGWVKLTVETIDGAGWVTDRFRTGGDAAEKDAHYELIYAGPAGRVVSDGDYSVSASSLPVLVRVEDVVEELVAGRQSECPDCEAVTVSQLEIRMKTTKPDGTVAETSWTPLGAMSFRVTAEGKNDLYLRVTDSLGLIYDTEALGTPLTVRIRYDQNRH